MHDGRYPEFLASLTRRDLVPLEIDESNPRTVLNLKAMENDSSHPFRHFANFVFVDPQEPIGILGQDQQWLRTYDIQGVYTSITPRQIEGLHPSFPDPLSGSPWDNFQ